MWIGEQDEKLFGILKQPFELLGSGLRHLSLSGTIGNAVAMAIYIAVCLIPVGIALYFVKNKKARFEDTILLVLSTLLFRGIYIFVNPSTIKVNKLNLNKLNNRINVYAVYQTRECEVYMTPSSFFDAKDGAEFSMTDTSKVKEEEGELEYSCSIEATIETVTPPEKTVLHQIDSNNKSIGVVEIDNSNIPESVELESETEYVIVEEYIGQDISNRYMVDMKFDEEIELYNPEFEEKDEENSDCIFVADRDEEELFMNEAMVELKKKLY